MSWIIDVQNQAVTDMLRQLMHKGVSSASILPALGEDMVERTKQRFASSTSPDGQRWLANTRATLMHYLNNRKGFSTKTGRISSKGRNLAIAKKPLQGKTGQLANRIFYDVEGEDLVLSSSRKYAAMQQFGGSKAQFKQLWGDVPARPFMPITTQGELSTKETEVILQQLRDYLMG
jgi:phage gpG-like protein